MRKSILRGLVLLAAVGAVPMFADWVNPMNVQTTIPNEGGVLKTIIISIPSAQDLTFDTAFSDGVTLGSGWSVTSYSATSITAKDSSGTNSATFTMHYTLGSSFFSESPTNSFDYSVKAYNSLTNFTGPHQVFGQTTTFYRAQTLGGVPESSTAGLKWSWVLGLGLLVLQRKKFGLASPKTV